MENNSGRPTGVASPGEASRLWEAPCTFRLPLCDPGDQPHLPLCSGCGGKARLQPSRRPVLLPALWLGRQPRGRERPSSLQGHGGTTCPSCSWFCWKGKALLLKPASLQAAKQTLSWTGAARQASQSISWGPSSAGLSPSAFGCNHCSPTSRNQSGWAKASPFAWHRWVCRKFPCWTLTSQLEGSGLPPIL